MVIALLTLVVLAVNALIIYTIVTELGWLGVIFVPMGLLLFVFPALTASDGFGK
jgi:hypothetical protein